MEISLRTESRGVIQVVFVTFLRVISVSYVEVPHFFFFTGLVCFLFGFYSAFFRLDDRIKLPAVKFQSQCLIYQ